jgi:hypothetical protein
MYRLLPATETDRNAEARYNIAPIEEAQNCVRSGAPSWSIV